jgi:hypothetical protein
VCTHTHTHTHIFFIHSLVDGHLGWFRMLEYCSYKHGCTDIMYVYLYWIYAQECYSR